MSRGFRLAQFDHDHADALALADRLGLLLDPPACLASAHGRFRNPGLERFPHGRRRSCRSPGATARTTTPHPGVGSLVLTSSMTSSMTSPMTGGILDILTAAGAGLTGRAVDRHPERGAMCEGLVAA